MTAIQHFGPTRASTVLPKENKWKPSQKSYLDPKSAKRFTFIPTDRPVVATVTNLCLYCRTAATTLRKAVQLLMILLRVPKGQFVFYLSEEFEGQQSFHHFFWPEFFSRQRQFCYLVTMISNFPAVNVVTHMDTDRIFYVVGDIRPGQ